MKRIILFSLSLTTFLFSDVIGQNRSITFINKPFAEITALAKKENKLIFMDAYASWCGPCKWMSANIFTNDTVADFYNSHFICIKMDMEKGEGVKLSEKYDIKAYPTLLFIRPDGTLVHLKVGAAQNVPDYIALAERALSPNECYLSCVQRYNQGENSPEFIYNYLKVLKDAYIPVESPLNKYFATQKETDFINNPNFRIIFSFSNDMDSREFKYLVSHQQEFSRAHGNDSVDLKIYNVFVKALVDLRRSEMMDDSTYNLLKKEIFSTGYKGAGKVIFDADLNAYEVQGDAEHILELAFNDLDKYYNNDPGMLNSAAWMFHEATKDKKYLEKALGWSKRSIDLKPDAPDYDTYAALMYDLGKKDEAIKYCKIAVDLALKAGVSTELIEEHLSKYQSGL
jgi:thiol-disulfide isomerase/thioredoxin